VEKDDGGRMAKKIEAELEKLTRNSNKKKIKLDEQFFS
jgi:hypothetical protein